MRGETGAVDVDGIAVGEIRIGNGEGGEEAGCEEERGIEDG